MADVEAEPSPAAPEPAPAPAPPPPPPPRTLPPLNGPVGLLYRILWIPLFLLALLCTTFLAYRAEVRTQQTLTATYDVGLTNRGRFADGLHVSPFTGEARRAGVGDRDLLVTIEGRPAPATDQAVAGILAGPDGSRVQFGLVGSDGQSRQVVLTRNTAYLSQAYAGSGLTFESRRWGQFAFNLAAALAMLAAAFLLFLRRPRDPVAAAISFGILLAWAIPTLLGLPLLWDVITAPLSFSLILFGLLFFPDGRFAPRWWALVAFAILADFAVSQASFWYPALTEAAAAIRLLAIFLTAAAVVTRFRTTAPGSERQQIKFVVLGVVAFLLFVALSWLFNQGVNAATEGGTRGWFLLLRTMSEGLAGISIAAGLLVSLLRYRLFDADAVIGRSAGYAVLTLMLAGTFAASAKLIELFFESAFGRDAGALPGAIGAGLAVVLITPMHNRIQGWAERRFQKDLLHLRRDLPDCVGDLRETASSAELLDEVLARVESGTRSTRSAVTLDGEMVAARGVAIGDAAGQDFPLSVPLRVGHAATEIGTLLVGPRPDGSSPGKDERDALHEIADPIARAIRIVRQREAREQALEQRFAALETALATRSP